MVPQQVLSTCYLNHYHNDDGHHAFQTIKLLACSNVQTPTTAFVQNAIVSDFSPDCRKPNRGSNLLLTQPHYRPLRHI